jgi:hypothetical protein
MANKTTRKQTPGASSQHDQHGRRRVSKRRRSGPSSPQTSSHPSSAGPRSAASVYSAASLPAAAFPAASFPAAALPAASFPAAAPRRFSARLASARDQQRLGERNREERKRVEKMLATAPIPLESPSEMQIEASVAWDAPLELRPNRAPRSLQGLTPRGCPVCGGKRVVCDEVIQLGTLRLSECLRCEHRWTERGPERWAEVGAPMKRFARRTSGTRPTQS